MNRAMRYLDYAIYWLIIILPFSMAIAPAPMSVFMGMLAFSFLLKKILKKERLFIHTKANLALLLLFALTCLSIVNSIDIKDTLRGGIGRLAQYLFILLICAEEVKDKKQIWRIFFSLALGALLVSFDSLWQVFSGKDFIRGYAPVVNIGLRRATASFKDPNTLGIYLSAIAPLVFTLTLYYLKGIKKIFFVFFSLVVLIGLGLTYSRPTLLAIYLVFFVLAIVRKDRMLIAILIIAALAFPWVMPQVVKDWAKSVDYNPVRFMCNDDRIAVYLNSLNMIKAHLLIGSGANTFMKNYKKYKNFPEYRNVVTADNMYAHNNFLHLTAELGFIGVAAFLWFLYRLFSSGIHFYRRQNDEFLRVITLALMGCLIAFLINGLTESSLYSSRVALIFWYLSGFLLAMGGISNADKA